MRWRAIGLTLVALPAAAGPPVVLSAEARPVGERLWTVSATIEHADEGWDHYVDAFRVVGPDGIVYGTRELLHPHVNEQPFTRSLARVAIPEGVRSLTVEARDSLHGWGAATATVALER